MFERIYFVFIYCSCALICSHVWFENYQWQRAILEQLQVLDTVFVIICATTALCISRQDNNSQVHVVYSLGIFLEKKMFKKCPSYLLEACIKSFQKNALLNRSHEVEARVQSPGQTSSTKNKRKNISFGDFLSVDLRQKFR